MSASAVTRTFDNANGGNYNTATNWSSDTLPTSADEVFFPSTLSSPVTIDFTGAGAGSFINGDSGETVEFALGGNIWTLSGTTESEIKGSYEITSSSAGGQVVMYAPIDVNAGGTLTVGSNVTVKADGTATAVTIRNTGKVVIDGGTIEHRNYTRDTYVESGGTLEFRGAGQSKGRYTYLRPGSTTRFVLTSHTNWSSNYSTNYPLQPSALQMSTGDTSYGAIDIDLAPGFTASVNDEFNAVKLSYVPSSAKDFDDGKFSNFDTLDTFTVDGYTFAPVYTSGTLKLKVTAVPAGILTWSNSAGGDYNTASNWTPQTSPSSTNTVKFTAGTTGDVTFAASSSAKNVSSDSGSFNVVFELNGNTWTLGSTESDFDANFTIESATTGAQVVSSERFVVGSGATLTLGANTAVKINGTNDQVSVDGTLNVSGAALQSNGTAKDIRAGTTGVIEINNGGTIAGRNAELANGSNFIFELNNTGYSSAPVSLADVNALGNVDLQLASGFSRNLNDVIPLISLSGTPTNGLDSVQFDDQLDTSTFSIDGYTFRFDYTTNALSLTVTAVPGGTRPAGPYTWNVSSGNYSASGSWDKSWVPDSTITAIFDSNATVNFTGSADAKNIDGTTGAATVAFNLAGNTWTLASTENEIKHTYNFTSSTAGGIVAGGGGTEVHSGGTLSVGSNVVYKGFVDGIWLHAQSGGTVKINGGTVETNGNARDVKFYAGSTLDIAGNGGQLLGRYLYLKPNSTTKVTLNNSWPTTYASVYPILFTAMELDTDTTLGSLDVQLGSGFSATVGTEFKIMNLTFTPGGKENFSHAKFSNLSTDLSTVTVGNYEFEADYTNGSLLLRVKSINTTTPTSYSFTAGSGSYNTAGSWDQNAVPDGTIEALFPTGTTSVTFSGNAAAKNFGGDAGTTVIFTLGGYTWTLGSTASTVNGDYALSGSAGSQVASSQQVIIASGGELTVNSGVALKASGTNMVNVSGTLDVAGGVVQGNTSAADLRASSTGVIKVRAGGTISGRNAELADGSTLQFELNNTNYSTAPVTLEDANALGNLSLTLASGFTAAVNDTFQLVSLSSGSPGFSTNRFDNVANSASPWSRITVGAYKFDVVYTNTSVSLVVAEVSTHPTGELFIYQGDSTSGQGWHIADNWDWNAVPDSSNTAYFGGGAANKTIPLTAAATAKNLNGDSLGNGAILDLAGNTLTLSNQNYVKSNFTITSSSAGGVVTAQTNGYTIDNGHLTIGPNAEVRGQGGIVMVDILKGSTLEIAGGSLAPSASAKRDIVARAEDTVNAIPAGVIRHSSGSVVADELVMEAGSSITFVLHQNNYASAPWQIQKVNTLQNIHFELGAGIDAPEGTVFNLFNLTFPETTGGFDQFKFANLGNGEDVTVGTLKLEPTYTNNSLYLTVVPPDNQYTFVGDGNTSTTDSWHTAGHWSGNAVPTQSYQTMFGTGATGETIILGGDAATLQMNSEASTTYTFDLNGYYLKTGVDTVTLPPTKHAVKGTWNFVNNSPQPFDTSNPLRSGVGKSHDWWEVHNGGVLRVGSDVKLYGGILLRKQNSNGDWVSDANNYDREHFVFDVLSGGLLEVLSGGRVHYPNTSENKLSGARDLHMRNGGTLRIQGDGLVVGRWLRFDDGSKVIFKLESENIGAEAPLQATEIHRLGDLDIEVGSSFNGQPGDLIRLMVDLGSTVDGTSFDDHRFDNAPSGHRFTVGTYVFEVVYDRTTVDLLVVSGGTASLPYHATTGVVEYNYYTDNVSNATAILDVPYGSIPSGYKFEAEISGQGISANTALAVGKNAVSLPIGTLNNNTEYSVIFRILDSGNSTVWTYNPGKAVNATKLIVRPNVTDRAVVQIDQYRGAMRVRPVGGLVDDFFPIGVMNITHEYLDPTSSQLNEAATAGFNLGMRWKAQTTEKEFDHNNPTSAYSQETVEEYLNALKDEGMYAFEAPVKLAEQAYYVKFGKDYTTQAEWDALYPWHNQTITPGILPHAKVHDAVIGYYSYDEPYDFKDKGIYMQTGVEEWYDIVRAADPYHPVMVLFSAGISGVDYWDAWDIPMRDKYVGSDATDVWEVWLAARDGVRDAAALGDSFLMTPLLESSSARPVALNGAMQRASTYASIIGGSKGIVYWYWPAMYKGNWDMLKTLAGEMDQLAPMLMERTPQFYVHWPTAGNHHDVKALVKNYAGRAHLLIVNTTYNDVTVKGQLPPRYVGTAESWFNTSENTSLTYNSDPGNGAPASAVFQITLEPFGRRVWKLPDVSQDLWQNGESLRLVLTTGTDHTPSDPNFVLGTSKNRVINSSFESDYGHLPDWPYGWTPKDSVQQSGSVGNPTTGRWTKDTTVPSSVTGSGTYSLKMERRYTGPDIDGSYWQTHYHELHAPLAFIPHEYAESGTHVLSLWAKTKANESVTIYLVRNESTWEAKTITGDSWQRVDWNWSKSGTSSDSLAIQLESQGTVWIDAVQLEQVDSGTLPTTYELVSPQ